MVVLIRCNDIVSDPRAMKYVRFFQEKGIDHQLIGWNRDGLKTNCSNAIMWQKKAGYNVGGLKAVRNRLGWMLFVIKQLFKLGRKDVVLHGCDLDCAFPAAVYKIFNRKAKLIFDIFDWFSATLYDQKSYILKAFKVIEHFTVKRSDKIILCEPERIEQIPFHIDTSLISIFPNIPFFEDTSFLKKDSEKCFSNNLMTISYVGGFSKDRCLFEIVKIAEEGIINLAIAGYGDKDLEERLKNISECSTIKYYGKVSYQDGLNISYNSDIMYAMYSKVNPNNIYAAPNKYYESMFLGKPLLTTKGTIVEKKVLKYQTGFVSEERKEDIMSTLSHITKDKIEMLGKKASSLWLEYYKDYTINWLTNEYKAFIEQ